MRKISFKSAVPFIFYLFLWQVLSLTVNEPMLFPSFTDVLKTFLEIVSDYSFYMSSLKSVLRIASGFLSALSLGGIFSYLSYKNDVFKSFMRPLVLIMKTVPVVSIIILLFMFLESSRIPFFVSFMMVFPIIYNNIYDGLKSQDKKLKEMADVFKVKGAKRLLYLLFPQIYPFIKSSCKTGIGVAFKSSVAAEVICVPAMTIGENLYNAKIYFDCASLLAYTFALVAFTFIFEKLFMLLLKKLLFKIEGGLKWI